MSRIGKLPIVLPKGVEVKIQPNHVISVKGPKGHLTEKFDPEMQIELVDGKLYIKRPTDQKRHKALHGLYRALLANMVKGVSEGFTKEIELIGVGFRASATGQLLELSVGYSHPVVILLPTEVKVTASTEKGKNPIIKLECADKQLLGQVAAKIRSIRKPEPYKGKGIRYVNEYVRRKAGKTAAK